MLVLDEALALPNPVFETGFDFTPPWDQSQAQAQAHGLDLDPRPMKTEPDRSLSPAEERRIRRMVSNRESARRSRMRKQRHLEDLRTLARRLRAENRDLSSRLGAVTHNCALYRHDNDRLRSESSSLRNRLSEISRFLLFRRLQRLSAQAPPPPPVYSVFESPMGFNGSASVYSGFGSCYEVNGSSIIA